jgi:hypothetical protein
VTTLTGHSVAGVNECPVCGGDCQAFPDVDHSAAYPFLPGGHDPMAEQTHVIAPHRIVDPDLQRVVYSTGQRVPLDDAVKYGLIEAKPDVEVVDPKAKPAPKRGKRARKPAEDRARKPTEDR